MNTTNIYLHLKNLTLSVFENSKNQLLQKENLQNALLLAAASVSGLVAVLYSKLFKYAENILLSAVQGKTEILFLATPVLFLLAWWLVYKFSPEAAGSGIPQVLVANELDDEGPDRNHVQRFLSVRMILVKAVSSIICVIGGGAIGREGPTLQISAGIFYLFGDKIKKFLPNSNSHLWIISGASAGLAAAFNTPLGGIIYAIEELGATHFQRIRTILLGAIMTSGLISLWLSGNYLYLGFPAISSEGISMLPMAILIGVISGLAGSSFSSLLFTLSILRKQIKSPKKLAVIALLCGLLMAELIYFASDASGSGLGLLNEFLFHGLTSDLKLIFVRFFGTIVSYLSGAAGGIFSPSLTIGGCIGGFIANLCNSTDQNLLVLLGMIGFLTGVTRTPFTSFILVVEMTNRHSAILPMMLTALIAQVGAKILHKHSFYERMKHVYLADIGHIQT